MTPQKSRKIDFFLDYKLENVKSNTEYKEFYILSLPIFSN